MMAAASNPAPAGDGAVAGFGFAAAAAGQVAAPAAALNPIPVPLAELFAVAAEREREGRLEEADRLLGHILAAEPGQPDALHLAGIVAFRSGRRAEALDLMRRSLAHGLNTPLYWRNICEVLRNQGFLDEALAAGRRAIALNPDDPTALHNLALIHAERLELAEAEARERQVLALHPGHAGAHFGLAELYLLQGDLARGWQEYEWRYRLPGAAVNLPPGDRPQWDGRTMPPGRVLVIADQGFGDAVQFGRYLPWVLERCPRALVACGREMRGVLAQLGATAQFHRWQDLPEHDAFIPLSGLPRLAGTTLGSVPAAIPYLHAEQARQAAWRARLDGLLPPGLRRVGLVWAGRPTHPNDHRRSANLQALAPLFALRDVSFVSLQKGGREAEIGRYFGAAPLLNLGVEIGDWQDTLAILASLDAVVSVDTAVAHVAGALGQPVHLMLPHAGEWRWLLDRSDSPWYPTMRLYRQPSPGQWGPVASEIAANLSLGLSQTRDYRAASAEIPVQV